MFFTSCSKFMKDYFVKVLIQLLKMKNEIDF